VFASLTQRALVLQATNTIQVALIVLVPVDTLVDVAHAPAVGVVGIALASTPPVAVVADNEIATRIAEAARQSGKAVSVLTIAIAVPSTCCLQILACG